MNILCLAGSRGERAKLSPLVERLKQPHDLACAYASLVGEVPTWDGAATPPGSLYLAVEDKTPASRIGAVLRWLEPLLEERRPDLLLVCGRSDAAVGAAFAASIAGITVAHLDAGLVLDRADPNGRLLDQAAAFLLAPHVTAAQRLAALGMEDSAYVCGDTLADAAAPREAGEDRADRPHCLCYLRGAGLDPAALAALAAALGRLRQPVLMPAGQRVRALLAASKVAPGGGLNVVEPFDYDAMQDAVARSSCVITDSATLQREAYFRATVALALSPADFPEAERAGWVRPVAWDEQAIVEAARTPAPVEPPNIEAHRGASLRAAQFVTGL